APYRACWRRPPPVPSPPHAGSAERETPRRTCHSRSDPPEWSCLISSHSLSSAIGRSSHFEKIVLPLSQIAGFSVIGNDERCDMLTMNGASQPLPSRHGCCPRPTTKSASREEASK